MKLFAQRLRLARRHAGCSQSQLGKRIGVSRNAVSQWETKQNTPSLTHLQAVAIATNVSFEWLATGRGQIRLSHDAILDSIPATTGLLIDDGLELRLLHAFREASADSRISLVEVAEGLAKQRRKRKYQP